MDLQTRRAHKISSFCMQIVAYVFYKHWHAFQHISSKIWICNSIFQSNSSSTYSNKQSLQQILAIFRHGAH